jgi:hypothetical protein
MEKCVLDIYFIFKYNLPLNFFCADKYLGSCTQDVCKNTCTSSCKLSAIIQL